MRFSDQLEQRFAEMITHYPTKRSVLVPMLLYVQDELGAITDEAIHELAQRVELSDLEVRNVISYYSMMRTHPIGKYNLQVCTNVSCLLRGGDEIFEHCTKDWAWATSSQRRTDSFIWKRSSVSAPALGPGDDVNYDFDENLTTEKIDELIDGFGTARSSKVIRIVMRN